MYDKSQETRETFKKITSSDLKKVAFIFLPLKAFQNWEKAQVWVKCKEILALNISQILKHVKIF